MGVIRPDSDGVLIDVLVQPRAARARIGPVHGDRLKVAVTAPPVDGRANSAVQELLSRRLSVNKSSVEITSGHSGRRKTVRIRNISAAEACAALGVKP